MNRFAAMGWMKISEKDDFKNGVVGNATMDGGHETFTGATIDELIKQCASFCGNDEDLQYCILDSCDEAGRLDVQVYENAEGERASRIDIAAWKGGTKELWLSTYTFKLLEVKPIVLSRNVTDKSLYAAS